MLPTVDSGSYPALSKKVRIEKSPEAGRYAVAEQAIRVGDILAVEKPYASVMNPAKYESHCHHCYEPYGFHPSYPFPIGKIIIRIGGRVLVSRNDADGSFH